MNDVSTFNWKGSDTRRPTRFIATFAVVLAIVIAVWCLPTMRYVLVVLEHTANLGPWGPVVVVFCYVLAAVLALPGVVLSLASGFMFGIPLGMITVWIGAGMGACAAFLVGRTFARDWIAGRIAGNPKLTALDKAIGEEGFKVVFLLRLSPILPFNFLNYALGFTRVSFKDYALASVMGMVPAEFLYVYIGSAARSLADVAAGKPDEGFAGEILFWGGLFATAVVTVFVTRLAKRSLNHAEASAEGDEIETEGLSAVMEPPLHVLPDDEYNRELVSNVHPGNWVNPEPAGSYDLVVIGAGTAGLVTAAAAAGLGAKVALIERFLLGGDCLNVGCVPSKTIIASSRVYRQLLDAERYGITSPSQAVVDFPAVMERMRRLRAKISHHDSAKRFRELGVDVFLGNGTFTGGDRVLVADKKLKFRKAVIATGARAVHPSIPGLAEAGFLTNETVFSLTQRPERLAVIGGGPIGCEMAQAFRRLGSQVFLLHKNDHILDREDPDAADILQKRFVAEGIQLILNSEITGVQLGGPEKVIGVRIGGAPDEVVVDEILIGVGRAPNVEDLGLESAGVEYDERSGVVVNDRLQTTNPNVYAAGDICMNYKFTHAADAAARMVVQNALFMGRKKLSALTIPWCTYTDPEIAHVGMYERDAQRKRIDVDTFIRPFSEVDRAIADGQEEGFVKVHVKKGTDEIVGATIVASHAGDMISQFTIAMVGKLGLKTLSEVIYPYPTQAEAIKQAADAYNRTRLTSFVKKVLKYWLSWTR
jgi:pyruvate/2-oxoglutarate dehydrogenase complex dihydrolipoamide dehydrogenase (E3) component/uncharacterized membrane protein YdjX (TVP38/TMEM64 family)